MEQNTITAEAVGLLLEWYKSNKRAMPWREEPTPYRVWISEIMLQQTRIEAVLPYFTRFIAALPDVRSLAEVPDDKLMKLWEGLGYYSRARNLKKAAKAVLSEYGGELPRRADELKKLSGVGDYTAGAISSIAYNEPEPAVDGNVLRVIARLTADSDDIARATTKKKVSAALRAVYPRGRDSSALTQAWMELGETVCLPNGAPLCGQCPLQTLCCARAQGNQTDYPVKSPKKERRVEQKTVVVLSCGGKIALRRRDQGKLLAGMWEFFTSDGALTEKQLTEKLAEAGVDGVSVADLRYRGDSVHIFTHIEWHMRWYSVFCPAQAQGFVWKTAEEIAAGYAVPSAFRYYNKLI